MTDALRGSGPRVRVIRATLVGLLISLAVIIPYLISTFRKERSA